MTILLDGELPVDFIFISSVAQSGLVQLKDSLWNMLNP
jgi:GTP-binding protein